MSPSVAAASCMKSVISPSPSRWFFRSTSSPCDSEAASGVDEHAAEIHQHDHRDQQRGGPS